MFADYWNNGDKGPQSARTEIRTTLANEAAITISQLRRTLKELKAQVASKVESDAIGPPANASIGQVCQLQHTVPGDTDSALVPRWGYIDAFHLTDSDGTRWKFVVDDGKLARSLAGP
jgi:hypothetical protein